MTDLSREGIPRAVLYSAVCLLLSMMVGTALGAPRLARAEPLNADPIAGEDTTLPWTALGLPREITLVGADTTQEVTLPVPSGLNAIRLRGLIHAPVGFGAGFVEIDDSRGEALATVDLPAATPSQAAVPFDVDIAAARVSGSALGLSLAVRQAEIPPEQPCGIGERLVISDLAAVFTGTESPSTSIATFFPPVLQRLVIYAPIDADGAEQQAVLTLTSAFARMYRPQATAITVVNHSRGATPPQAPQFTRAVVVESGDAGLNVINAGQPAVYLKMTGRGDQLTEQASLVVNRLQSLVQQPNARVNKAGSDADADSDSDSDSDEMSFRQLNLGGESDVLGTSNFTVGVDRSALGVERVDNVGVHLLAIHTPVAALDSASLMVRVNGQAVYTSALDDSGRVDAVFDVPGELLAQRINFEFDLTFSPRQLCNPTLAPMTIQLDPRSTLTMRRGGQALGGFSAVPSELNPEFLVALDGSSQDQLDYAAQVVAAIARTTGTTLMPRVVDVRAASDASTAALIVANAATLKLTSMRPPIGGESADVQVGLRDELRADIGDGLGSIQVFTDEPRNRTVILVTTSGAWSLVPPLFGYIDQLPDGWAALDGDVLAAGTEGTVTNLTIGADEGPTATAGPAGRSPLLLIGAGCLALVTLGLGAALWRRRRTAA